MFSTLLFHFFYPASIILYNRKFTVEDIFKQEFSFTHCFQTVVPKIPTFSIGNDYLLAKVDFLSSDHAMLWLLLTTGLN